MPMPRRPRRQRKAPEVTSTHSDELQRRITLTLKAAGWTREDAAEALDWPDFAFPNPHGRVELLYPPDEDWLRLGFLSETQQGYLKVEIGEQLSAVLGVITSMQNDISGDTWERLIDDLLAIPTRVYALQGEDGDDVVELTAEQ